MSDDARLVSVSTAHHADAYIASQKAALAALGGLGKLSPAWGMAFCGGRLDPTAAWRGLSEVLPGIPLIGGATPGIIAAPKVSYTGFECGLILFAQPLAPIHIISAQHMSRDPFAAGVFIGEQLQNSITHQDTIFLTYESMVSGRPALDGGSQLLRGLQHMLGQKMPRVLGSVLLGDIQVSNTFLFAGQHIAHDMAVAVVFPPQVQAHTTILHACYPVSTFLEVTRCEGPLLLELDGRPALDVLRHTAPNPGWNQPPPVPSVLATLGQKLGDPFAPYDEAAYVNHMVVGFDPDTGSVAVIEGDFAPGDQLQVMARDDRLIHESVGARTRALLDSLRGQELVFGLYVDCATRSSTFTGCDEDEADLVLAEFPPDFPLLGWYSAVEIGPVDQSSRPMNWTGVLSLFSFKEDLYG